MIFALHHRLEGNLQQRTMLRPLTALILLAAGSDSLVAAPRGRSNLAFQPWLSRSVGRRAHSTVVGGWTFILSVFIIIVL